MQLLIARNPEPDSSLPYLMLVPLGDGLVFRTKGTWPRTSAIYCHPVPRSEWPSEPDLVEQIPLRSCERRGAAIDIIADRGREQRSQLVFTTARGREMVFWQAPRTRKQARPNVRVPTARASGLPELAIVVDAHERYPYRFAKQQVVTTRRGLRCGDYGVELDGVLVAAVERKSLSDLVGSLTSGRLRFALAELAALPRAAVVVEDRYSQVFAVEHVRPAVVADGLAELQVRWPTVPLVFCETRTLAEEWTYRYLAAALTWIREEADAERRVTEVPEPTPRPLSADAAGPSTAEIRAWALLQGFPVADRGRLKPEIVAAWQESQAAPPRS
ncbi:ERCC4 domain-containing protein [uncultured Friedmanniella sp.]|uniref:ERCC4 domain-containing protein n=1 Tax=uncultured Friedmanniella sp. TaxID=335381 RepID=UPI0035CA46FF